MNRFVDLCEGLIENEEWDLLRACFLPTARILYREPDETAWQTLTLDAWLASMQLAARQPGYGWTRRIEEIEPDPEEGHVVVRGEVREALLIPGERHAFEMREGLAIVRYRGSLRIASAVYEIRRREVEEVGP